MKRYILSMIMAAAMISCSDELTMSPAVSFFAETPEMNDNMAIFRLATSFVTDSTERLIPVTFGGTAELGTDYKVSDVAFVLGGSSPVDSIVVSTLKFGTGKDVTLSLDLPEGMAAGKFQTSGFTIQDNPAYITFDKAYGILADSLSIPFSVTDKAGKKKAILKNIEIVLTMNSEKSSAREGMEYEFADSAHFTIKAGQTKGEIKIRQPEISISTPDKEKLFLNISHDQIYGDGKIPEMEIQVVDKKWGGLQGKWKMNEIVTDSLYLAEFWGEGYSGLDKFPKFNLFDAVEFDVPEGLFKPSFYSNFENYFIGDSNFRIVNHTQTDFGGREHTAQSFLLDNTNRYFSEKEKSEDTESHIYLNICNGVENTADTLDMFIIDYTSRSFLPELESEGKYAPEKPVATSPGLYLKLRFTKD